MRHNMITKHCAADVDAAAYRKANAGAVTQLATQQFASNGAVINGSIRNLKCKPSDSGKWNMTLPVAFVTWHYGVHDTWRG